eukprot:gb/GFBE01073828.1/.p1 GENE.gb/GFBE01073828.1/~~gb/GFBE01073828.1/.p1  ORF type:complete len:375 (+),score=78.68 gb/GFBE01073828.1/:1-1125(+)
MFHYPGEDCEGAASGPWHQSVGDGVSGVDRAAIERVALFGDFYRQQEDVYRGLTLDTMQAPVAGAAYEEEFAWQNLMDPSGPMADVNTIQSVKAHQEEKHSATSPPLRFDAKDVPPMLPEDRHFNMEATHLLLNSQEEAAWEAGNRLLEILDEEATAEIKKVNRQKFTVKAVAFWQGLTCEIKLRAYGLQGRHFAFEFQRVRGDSLAFNGLFRLIKQHLTSPCSEEVRTGPAFFPPTPPVAFVSDEAHNDSIGPLTPLIDAAFNAEDVHEQAEVAAGLAAVAEDDAAARTLCTPKASAAIRKLLEVNCFEVVCHVARLLSRLALSPGAEVCFPGEGLLPLLNKVWKQASGKLLKAQLETAMSRCGERCGEGPQR